MRMNMLLAGLLIALPLLFSGCYEKKVCCPVDGGCDTQDAGSDADAASDATLDATPDAS